MKLAACFLIVVLSAYIGRLLSKNTENRLSFFRGYYEAFITISERIINMNLELYKALKIDSDSGLSEFLSDCSDTLKSYPQASFSAIWRECVDRAKFSILSKEDIKVMKRGGEAIEHLCANPSEKQSLSYIKSLAAYVEQMEKDKQKKCKLYNTTCILGGLFIALLMI
jgi:stage III sporulation protein AB